MSSVPPNIFDGRALAALRSTAGERTPEANKEVARQFETLFMQMLFKQMRETVPKDGMFNSESTRFYQGLQDQQMAATLAQKGGLGLASVIERQLNGDAAAPMSPYERFLKLEEQVQAKRVEAPVEAKKAPSSRPASPQAFVDALWPQATQAAASLGVPAHFLVGHAALETGWGRSQIRMPDGSPSHNLFGIKATSSWTGKVVEARTTEYENGVAKVRVERFRAYDSYAEAFNDYARLIKTKPRYAEVLGQNDAHAFARALQQGGYATDPAYAQKLARVINGGTMRQSLLASAGAAALS